MRIINVIKEAKRQHIEYGFSIHSSFGFALGATVIHSFVEKWISDNIQDFYWDYANKNGEEYLNSLIKKYNECSY